MRTRGTAVRFLVGVTKESEWSKSLLRDEGGVDDC